MRSTTLLLTAAMLAGGSATPALAQSSGDQASARQEMRDGKVLPAREIERRVIQQMRGHEYLGFEYDAAAAAYRLKFIRDGRVVWVDVDARTARVLQISK